MSRLTVRLAALALLAAGGATDALAQAATSAARSDGRRQTVFDLPLGAHAYELPTRGFMEFACGSNGGPPGRRLASWANFSDCRPDADTGLFEVAYRYDDEMEYRARAQALEMQVLAFQFTEAYNIPIVVSALFDADGFYVGYRMATDPRVPVETRELGATLGGHLSGRFGEVPWSCTDLERLPRESEFQGTYVKRRCSKPVEIGGQPVDLVYEVHNLRRAGQFTIDPRDNMATAGQFESTTWFQARLAGPPADREARRTAILAAGPPAPDPLIARARDCAGCDLSGAELSWADLSGANLAGANLAGANLHGANLMNANLAGANLVKANLNRTNLRLADLSGANLQEAMLYAAMGDGANLAKARLAGTLAAHSQFQRANFTDAMIYATDFRDSRLNDANFTRANLSNSWIHNALLIRANLSGAVLNYVIAQQSRFTEADFTGADVRGADLFGANFRDAKLTNADFSFTILGQANLAQAELTGTKFEEAELPAGFRAPQN